MPATQKSILITGCSSGIGYASAHYLRDRGWKVFASCRKPDDCARLIEEGIDAPLLDYQAAQTISDAVAYVTEKTGGTLDALFNNGAFAIPGAVEDLPTDALRAIFEANFFGWHDLTRHVIPVFRAQGHGRIVQCSSVLGFVPMKWRGAYVSSKFALEGLTDVLRLEMKGTDIHVVLIEPGPITSRIRQNAIPHFERWIDTQNSALADQYEALRHRLYSPPVRDPFELPDQAVAKKLLRALVSRNPQPRYYVTTPTRIAGTLKRLLSTRLLDRILGGT